MPEIAAKEERSVLWYASDGLSVKVGHPGFAQRRGDRRLSKRRNPKYASDRLNGKLWCPGSAQRPNPYSPGLTSA